MIVITEADQGRTVDVRRAEPFAIELDENAATGYRWTVDRYADDLMALVDAGALYPSAALGSGGKATFTFEGRKPGAGDIVLKHWRAWEGDASVLGRFQVRVNVLP